MYVGLNTHIDVCGRDVRACQPKDVALGNNDMIEKADVSSICWSLFSRRATWSRGLEQNLVTLHLNRSCFLNMK